MGDFDFVASAVRRIRGLSVRGALVLGGAILVVLVVVVLVILVSTSGGARSHQQAYDDGYNVGHSSGDVQRCYDSRNGDYLDRATYPDEVVFDWFSGCVDGYDSAVVGN